MSRQLAAQAELQIDDRLDLGLLLSVEASRAANTRDALRSLRTMLAAVPAQMRFLHGPIAWVTSVAFSPDGRTLATGGNDGIVKALGLRARCAVWSVTHWPRGLRG